MNLKQIDSKFTRTTDELYRDGIEFIEVEARKLMRKHPFLIEFIMGMGVAMFTTKKIVNVGNRQDNESVHLWERTYLWKSPLGKFIDKWNDEFHFMGEPMRFTATGPKITNW